MLRPYIKIDIQQVTKSGNNVRNKLFSIDFVNEYEISSGWELHTDTAKIKLPKNIYIQPSEQEVFMNGSGAFGITLGGLDQAQVPLFMRGDEITITDGYFTKNENSQDVLLTKQVFKGFISAVKSDVPIEIDCEDNFFLLKKTPFGASTWDSNMLFLCSKILEKVNAKFGTSLTLSTLPDAFTASFTLGHLEIGELSCGEILAKLRTQYHLESFFVGDVLHFGFPIYDDSVNSGANNTSVFEFQNNIHDNHSLTYTNKEDVILSALVKCKVIQKTGKKTKDGYDATKVNSIREFIYWDIVSESFKGVSLKVGDVTPENEGGERHEFIYAVDPYKTPPDSETLKQWGINQLKKFYYTGFRGSFETFGYPFVSWNDNITLLDSVIKDRTGVYKVKKVVRKGGKGIKQEIYLDFKYDIPIPNIKDTEFLL